MVYLEGRLRLVISHTSKYGIFTCVRWLQPLHMNVHLPHKLETWLQTVQYWQSSLQESLGSQKVICLSLSGRKHVPYFKHNHAKHMLRKCCVSKSYKE